MRRAIPWQIAALSLTAICGVTAILWSRSQAHAAIPPTASVAAGLTQYSGFEGQEIDELVPDVPKVYVRMHFGPEAISAYKKLHKKIDMPFAQETPLGDVLKHLSEQLNPADKDEEPLSDDPPLQFYVNPEGLEEAEKTIDSPITLDLKQIPVSTALELSLDQLGLEYRVRPDGIVEIDATGSKRSKQQEPMLLILNELKQLRIEVSQLRTLHGGMRGGMGSGPPNGGGLR